MLKKNVVLKDVEIIDYTYEGLGIAKVDNFVIFVLYGKLNKKYDIKITKVEKSYSYATIISENDLEYKCPHFKVCGGCQIQHLTYDEQLDFKEKTVSNLASKNKIDTTINKIASNDNPYYYRNKVQMPFYKNSLGEIRAGFYKKRSHDIIEIDKCYLQSELVNEIVDYTCKVLNEVSETVYDEDKHKGNLRHLYIRESQVNEEVMVVFVCNSNTIKSKDYVVKQLTSRFKVIKSIVINENTRRTNAVLGYKNYNLYNCNFINENLEDLRYRLSPNVFFQVNTLQAVKMYNLINESAELTKEDTVLDAYCGTGSISLFLANYCKEVVGIEIVKPSIDSANSNMKMNNINNASFICGDIKDKIKNFEKNYFDVVVVDPPRKGLDNDFINTMLNYQPKRLVYVSCNPDTLMRDLKKLEEKYIVNSITPVDMFSQTYHVESVCKLTLRNG